MADLAAKLAVLGGASSASKERLLADLAELLNRSGYRGGGSEFSFHDPEIAVLPSRLSEAVVRSIALRVGSVLLDPHESEQVRATAAFVLGKTHVVEALEVINKAIFAAGTLPYEVARQCAFAYDALIDSCGHAGREIEPDVVGRHFMRHNIQWDAATQRVVVDHL